MMQVARWVCRIDSCCSRVWKTWGSGANPLGPTIINYKNASVAEKRGTILLRWGMLERYQSLVPKMRTGVAALRVGFWSQRYPVGTDVLNQTKCFRIPIGRGSCLKSSILQVRIQPEVPPVSRTTAVQEIVILCIWIRLPAGWPGTIAKLDYSTSLRTMRLWIRIPLVLPNNAPVVKLAVHATLRW